jgi:hypothetical protein
VLVEVKAVADSKACKALSQVALAASAVLEAMKRLRARGDARAKMGPVLGFVVDVDVPDRVLGGQGPNPLHSPFSPLSLLKGTDK